jgi:hypothetical protein
VTHNITKREQRLIDGVNKALRGHDLAHIADVLMCALRIALEVKHAGDAQAYGAAVAKIIDHLHADSALLDGSQGEPLH